MRHNNNCILKVDKEFLKPCDGIEIQMVSRLIEKKNVRITKKCLCKKNLDLCSTWHICHKIVVLLSCDSKSVKKSSSIRFSIPAVHISKLSFKLAGADTIFVGEILFHIYSIFFLHDIVKTLVTHDYSVKNCKFIILKVILL